MNAECPKKLIIDDSNIKSIDKDINCVNIEEISIEKSINEFISIMTNIKHKQQTINKLKQYYMSKL